MPWKNDFIVHWGNDGKEMPRVVLQHLHFSPGQILLKSDRALPGISDVKYQALI